MVDAGIQGGSPGRVLIIKPSALGDVVTALPVLRGLRTRYPRATIDWLIATPFAPLVEDHPALDGVVRFDRRRFGRLGRSLRVTKEFIQFCDGLRASRYDLVIDLQGLFRTGFLSWVTGAPVRIGFRQAREVAWVFYTHRLMVDDPDVHAVDKNYLVAGLLGFEDVPVEFGLELTDSLRSEAQELLRAAGVHAGERVVAVVPGARWETKRWPPERFVETLDLLQNESGVRAVLIGGPDEVDLCTRIAGGCRTPPINLAGRTTVRHLAAVVGLADGVLCQDSAAMHLAVALDRPLVCLTGPTNPRRTGPYSRLKDVIRLDLECSPCYFRRLARCPHGHKCMHDLVPRDVVAAVNRSLNVAVSCPH